MIQERDDIVALDSAIIQHPRTWEASGHLAGFSDPLVECRASASGASATTTCARRPRRAAQDPRQAASARRMQDCELTEAREFNLMFETTIGPVKDAGSTVYLRPETAQGIFLDFKTTLQFARKKPPFGIAQIGKSFRNEITPGNFIFRTLEFEQMEMEFFVPPDEAEQWHELLDGASGWSGTCRSASTATTLRLRAARRRRAVALLSATSDIEYLYPIGWSELEGIANRGDFDLTQHAEYSGQKLEYVDTATGERYVPHVIEPAAGRRAAPCWRCSATPTTRTRSAASSAPCCGCTPHMAPIKVAVLPLVNKDGQPEKARAIYEELRTRMSAEYDAGGSIGKRYRRQDEIGTPWGVTVDHQTMEDDTVTLRDRDTLEQDRVPVAELAAEIERRLAAA